MKNLIVPFAKKIILFSFLLVIPLHAFATTLSLLSTEADEDLQHHASSSLESVMAEFTSKGGTLVRLNQNDPTIKALLLPNDVVYPACSFGFCRSQTLWSLLRDYDGNLSLGKIVLFPPHATRYGFDPYNGKVNWHRITHENLAHVQTSDEFELWAFEAKAKRIGFDIFSHLWDEKNASVEQLEKIKAYYDENYYGPKSSPSCQRRVYFSFDKNTHAILYRLNQTNQNLEKVIVYHFPLKDLVSFPLAEWNTFPLSYKAYHEFSKILLNSLDFSQLK